MCKQKFYIEAQRRKKLVNDMSQKFNNMADIQGYLTDKMYSQLTGIHVPYESDERAYKRFKSMKQNDINKIEANFSHSSMSSNVYEPQVFSVESLLRR